MEGRQRYLSEMAVNNGEVKSNVGLAHLNPQAIAALKEYEDKIEQIQGEKVILLAYSEDKTFDTV